MQRNQRQTSGQQRGQWGGGQGQRGRQNRESFRNERGNQSQAGRQGFRGEMPFYERGDDGQHFDDDQNEQWNRGPQRYPETQQGGYYVGQHGMYEQGGFNSDGDESFNDDNRGRYGVQSHERLPYGDNRYAMNQMSEGPFGNNRFGNQENRYGGGGEGRERQSFFGRGPKGYKRSDERIKEDVSDRIAQLGHIDATDVEVTVTGGEVTLMGNIPDRSMKYELEHLVLGVVGVNDVNNQLRLKREETGSSGRAGKGSEDKKNLGAGKM